MGVEILKRRLVSAAVCILFVLALLIVGQRKSVRTGGEAVKGAEDKRIKPEFEVVLDAGHGGFDPGKVGIGGVLEKDINLQIVMLLKEYLEAEDVSVTLTRDSDRGLYDENSSRKKVEDMKNRVAMIAERNPDLTVSIHQNSYPEEYVHGAQVFYYKNSAEGQQLAQTIQDQIVFRADADNTRQIKANESYYLLKKTPVPIVIVECGFLSNAEEAGKLSESEYQQRMAWAVHMGIMRYLNGKNVN